MKNRKRLVVLFILCLLVASLPIGPAVAIEPRESPVFESGYVMIDSSLFTEFGAATHKVCKSIYVSSCTLQEMNSAGAVVSSTSLTPPTTKAQNASDFTAWATYSGTSGKRYRIKAVFYADGYTITRYSNTITY